MRNLLQVFLVLIVTVCFATSCVKLHEDEDRHYKIYFENKWNKPIMILFHMDWHWYDNPYDQYVAPFYEQPIPKEEWNYKIQPGSIDDELMKYNAYYETALEDKDTVVISVYNAENPKMEDKDCFLVRYHLSKEDLHKVKYRISFPPTELMRNIYMKPSYDEIIKEYVQ